MYEKGIIDTYIIHTLAQIPGSCRSSLSAPNLLRKAAGGRGNDTPKVGNLLVFMLKGSNDGFKEAPRNVSPTLFSKRDESIDICERE